MINKKQTVLVLAVLAGSCLAPAQTITTIAGSSAAGFSGDGGPGASALLNSPNSVATDAAGNVYVADAGNNRIRKIAPDGTISTVAGNGGPAPGALNVVLGDGGPATSAQVYSPTGVAVDAAGNIYISTADNRVRKVTTDGIINTIAGSGFPFFSGDGGPATSAGLSYGGLAVDAAGNIYLADSLSQRIRKITTAGVISTVAGNGTFGYSGDGGPATSAELSLAGAGSVAVDGAGNLYIADLGNNRVRKVKGGTISTVAGNGTGVVFCLTATCPIGDGGPATSANLTPHGVVVDGAGNIYVGDNANNRVRKINTAGVITTVAGGATSCPVSGFCLPQSSGDGGPATSAGLAPVGVALDSSGNLDIADYLLAGTVNGTPYLGNNRVRQVAGVGSSVGPAPVIGAGGIVNGASFGKLPPAAGSIVSLFGTNLAASTVAASALPLPITLGGVSVTVNGVAAPLFFVSAGQINFQIPWEVGSATTASVIVTTNGNASSAASLTLAASGPGVFTINSTGSGQGAIQISNTATFAAPIGSIPGASAQPVARGQYITVYCSGLGAVQNPPASGVAASGQTTVTTPSMTIGGVPITPSFSGLAPGFVGLYQVNAQVPQSVTPGNAVAVVITANGVAANSVTIAVQ